MMITTNIKYENNDSFLDSTISKDLRPGRYAIATNLIMCTKNASDEYSFLLFNYEPEKWNQWYPYFSSVNSMHEFHGITYRDILDEFENGPLHTEAARNRLMKAKRDVMSLLHIENLTIKESPIPLEVWLKFSKTQNLWTFYYIEFLQIIESDIIDIYALDPNVVTFMPLDSATINEVLKTGKYKGTDVVENTLDILGDSDLIDAIKSNAIMI